MRWDDCFNHLFSSRADDRARERVVGTQTVTTWKNLYWHASFFTAGVLRLMDIPEDHIVEKSVRAKKVVLPWMQGLVSSSS